MKDETLSEELTKSLYLWLDKQEQYIIHETIKNISALCVSENGTSF